MKNKLPQQLAFGLITVCSLANLTAQTWNGSTDSLWSEAANWTPSGTPAAGANVSFATAGNQTVNLGGVSRQVGTATFNSSTSYLLENGTLSFATIGATAPVFFQNGAGNITFNSAVNFEGPANSAIRDLKLTGSGEIIFNGDITRASSVQLRVDGGTVRFTGNTGKTMGSSNFLIGASASGETATLILNMGNQTAQNTALGNAGLYLTNGILELQGFSATLANTLTLGSGDGTIQGGQALTINGKLATQGSRTLTFNNGSALTTINGNVGRSGSTTNVVFGFNAISDVLVNGVVSNDGGTVNFSKTGTGTVTFSANNTYTGTTNISEGRLVINGNQSLATGNVTVGLNGVLAGSGTLGGITTVSGQIAPGNSVGELSFAADLNFASGGSYEWEISNWTGNSPGSSWDHISVQTGSSLNVTATSGSPFTIYITELNLVNFSEISRDFIIATAADGISGFDLSKFVLNTDAFTAGSGMWSLNQVDNTLVLSYGVIPEASSLTLLVGCLSIFALRRRFKK